MPSASLLGLVNDARPYRRIWTAQALPRRHAVVCVARHAGQALTWFLTKYGRAPDFLATEPAANTQGEVKVVPLAALASLPEVEVIVFGPGERKLAMMLASVGVRCFSFAFDPVYKHIKYDPGFLARHGAELDRVHDLLADEESRMTLASVIKQRITSDHGHLRIATYREYEHPLVRALPGEWVADCGASDGETSFRFARQVGAGGRVFAFEPDPQNVARIEAGRAQLPPSAAPVTIIQAAVSDKPGSLRFASGQGDSS